jgi:tRNA pseudouridine38-40 synthase
LRFALKFAYNGNGFFGYARQPNLRTVEGEILKILVKKDIIKDAKQSNFRSASRTDKEVSSLGNVVSFNSNSKGILSCLLDESEDIIFYGIKEVDTDFNPRHAKNRHYRYYLKKDNLDLEKIVSTLSFFTGEHNFSNFARVEKPKSPIRIIENIVYEFKEDFLIIDFFAPNFLWNQIRRIISSIEKVGTKKITKNEVEEALSNPDESFDFGVASAKPLILKDIFYDFDFEYNDQKNKLQKLEKGIFSNL